MVCLHGVCFTHASVLQRFMHIMKLLITCPIADNSIYPDNYADSLKHNQEFDFIVIGAGSAGSALANRLSEIDAWNVLLIEAGGHPSLLSETPTVFLMLTQTEENWGYLAEPGNYCQGMIKGKCAWPRGKDLGGTSAVNGMLYIRSNPSDHERWVADGADGWDWAEAEKYYKKLDFDDGGGYVRKSHYSYQIPMRNILLDNNQHLNNTGEYIGYREINSTIYDGRRFSIAKAYLPALKHRKNFKLAFHTFVNRIYFDPQNSSVAKHVEIHHGHKRFNVTATKEIILSAGTINSPQILMLSGVGPSDHLAQHKIPVVADLPVGKNLQDHVAVLMYYEVKQKTLIVFQAPQYCLNRTGNLAQTNMLNLLGFLNTKDDTQYPNIQTHHTYYSASDAFTIQTVSYCLDRLEARIDLQLSKVHLLHDILMMMPTLLHPRSRGEIKLASKKPQDKVKIYPNYFGVSEDADELLTGVRELQRLVNLNPELKDSKLLNPGGHHCKKTEFNSDDYWRCMVRVLTMSLYHPIGTCKMGDPASNSTVVDPRLKVLQFQNLRVVDASVMPLLPSCNTNIPTVMIAERAADLIKQDWGMLST